MNLSLVQPSPDKSEIMKYEIALTGKTQNHPTQLVWRLLFNFSINIVLRYHFQILIHLLASDSPFCLSQGDWTVFMFMCNQNILTSTIWFQIILLLLQTIMVCVNSLARWFQTLTTYYWWPLSTIKPSHHSICTWA